MKHVLVLGAGRSSSSLIDYLIRNSATHAWQITVGDMDRKQALALTGDKAEAIEFDITNEAARLASISKADVVISMLPAHYHSVVARLCLQLGKHLLTASYVSPEMRALHTDAVSSNVLFLNECGLDPGIDHMSAMMIMDKIRSEGGVIHSFESFTGGLIAPDTDPDNPWRYKFTWNPRNVVMAGQSTARFREEANMKYIPYQQLFRRTTAVHVKDLGDFEGYANRDSLSYKETYGLDNVKTLLRGTLRYKGFCEAWNILVQLGCCDDSFLMNDVHTMTHRDFINAFLPYHASGSVEEKLCALWGLDKNGGVMQRLRWSGFFDNEEIGLTEGTPARLLEHILNKKWELAPTDKDLIVMWHRFTYEQGGSKKEIQASLVAYGENSVQTAMAKTVGLPLAIATRLLLEDKIKTRGVAIPVMREIYEPVLKELGELGVMLTEY